MVNERLSRRDFLNLSTHGVVALPLLSHLGKESSEDEPLPLTDLPALFTDETPVQIIYLDRHGNPSKLEEEKPHWKTLSGIPLDILTPLRPLRSGTLGLEWSIYYPFAWTAKLPHITGSPTDVMVIAGWGERDKIEVLNGSLLRKKGDLVSTYAYSEQRNINAQKIYNLLTILSVIAERQKDFGPLLPDEEFSYLRDTNLTTAPYSKYKVNGYWAGGVCASVSTLSKAVLIAQAGGYTEITKRSVHTTPLQYWASPLDPGITKANSDATVFFRVPEPLSYSNVDFRFKLKPDSPPLYFSFRAMLEMDPKPHRNHWQQPGDARLSFSISLQKNEPLEDEEEQLLNLRATYEEFHPWSR